VIEVVPREGEAALTIDHLKVRLPRGKLIVGVENLALRAGEHVLVTGPSGAGKSTLFRALGGIWPFGSGRVTVPKDAKVMLLPQRPYFPVGTLAAAVSFPAKAGALDNARIAEALVAVGLPDLVGRLGEEAHWNRMLSLGEQQRLGIAHVLLQPPDYLLLDEATASLDEAAEAALYRLLQERLKGATIISIGHRSTLGAFHGRRIALMAADEFHQAREVTLVPAAE
jgi:putative ATP-binding cassette transporter